jgi:Ca2+/H+ antiporter, TMEM165/GDT1 family
MWEELLLYLTIFVMAATPWIEILVVVPFGIGIGLNPVLVALFSFAGNMIPIYFIVVGFERLNHWWARRRGKYLVNPSDDSWQSGQRARALRVLRRYGVPGLSLLSPILIGAHLGAVITLLLKAPKNRIIAWMTASIAIWTVVLTIASWAGFGWLSALWN